ncbi:MAG: DUF1802 family protein [Cytophagales bacterium]|nr:DUF1802 family protein [Cytophaga sp.]
MALAFKEWACIVDALGKGKQSIILRKGGISEGGNGDFELKGKQFLLFPTLFHQSDEMIKPDWKPFLSDTRFHQEEGKVNIKYYVQVADVQVLTDWEKVKKLNAYHAWKEEIIRERFERWGNSIHLLIVQVFEFGASFNLDILPEYGGCKSWTEIDKPIEFVGRPVLNRNVI